MTLESREKRKPPKQRFVRQEDPPPKPRAPQMGALQTCQPPGKAPRSAARDSEILHATAAGEKSPASNHGKTGLILVVKIATRTALP